MLLTMLCAVCMRDDHHPAHLHAVIESVTPLVVSIVPMGASSSFVQAWQCVAAAECAVEEKRAAEAVQDRVGSLEISGFSHRPGAALPTALHKIGTTEVVQLVNMPHPQRAGSHRKLESLCEL